MLQNPAIEILGISKAFSYRKTHMRHSGALGKAETQITALKNICLQIPKGECLGIIGGNGAGKSTLLKILAGTLKPDSGKVILRGRTASILDIGAGLHPDLSGWENIFMGGTLMGKTNAEVKQVAPQIIAFSGLKDFMDLPVKHYSTGMFMRLAFSIATHFEADIILLDEIYSVGDINFREKCAQVIVRLKQEGKTIVLVSHELQAVQGLCSTCVLMDNGTIVDMGETRELIEKYVEKSLVDQQKTRNAGDLKEAIARTEELENAVDEVLPAEEPGELNPDEINEPLVEEQNAVDAEPLVSASEDSMVQNEVIAELPKSDLIRYVDSRVYAKDRGEITMLSDILIEVTFEQLKSNTVRVSLHLNLGRDMPIMGLSPYRIPLPHSHTEPGLYTLRVLLPKGWLNNGLYTVDFLAVDENDNLIVLDTAVSYFKVQLKLEPHDKSGYTGKFPGPFLPILNWESIKH